jgi:NAD(P)-dependent dehydrogenase (short-subunit alcohol dehydrogenase family)
MVCRDVAAGQSAEEVLRDEGLDVSLFVADLESVPDIERLREDVEALFDRVDVLANCAGVNLDDEETTIEDLSLGVLTRTMNVNFRAPLWMCRSFIPLLRESESGRIINFTSGLGRLSVSRMGPYPAYSISKTALNGLTRTLAAELADTDIMVFSVDPGWVRTDMGGPEAPLSVEEGIQTPLWLATADAEELESGCLYHRKEIVSW